MLAYLDAGTGSMVIATVAAGAAGAGVAVKAGLSKLRRKPKQAPVEDVDGDEAATDDDATTEDEATEPAHKA